jgi:protein tyrosine/serine phosphatase
MIRAYRSILQQGKTAYTQVVRHILEHPPPSNAFIVHCTAGKDRTGVLCALLLSLCGVPDDVVADEYSLTNIGLGDWLEHLVHVVIRHTGANEEAARRMAGARRGSMVGAVDMLKNEFGGAEGYFKSQCGLSDEEIDKIKSFLIVEEQPIVGLLKN